MLGFGIRYEGLWIFLRAWKVDYEEFIRDEDFIFGSNCCP